MSLTPQIKADLKRLGLNISQVTVNGLPATEIPEVKQKRYGRYRSKWEAMYAAELDAQLRAGWILQWEYEPWSLKLTEARVVNGKTQPGIRYTPDFVVWRTDRTIICVEIKGHRRNASINRYKLACEKFPLFSWMMLTRKTGQWELIG